jgi:hypothetical protein
MTQRKKHREYEVGDLVWLYIGDPEGKKYPGKVVHKFQLPDYSFKHYVVEIDTHVDPLLEVRCWGTLSDTEDGYLNYFCKH